MLTDTQSPPESSAALPSRERVARWRVLSLPFALWVAGVVGVLALWMWVLWSFRGQPGDDPHITYRYAYNLAHGNGFVFNSGEYVQSTTTPLFTLILAAGALLGFDIPALAYGVNALALLAFGVCCVGLVSHARDSSPWLGLATVALVLVCPVTLFGLGSEMPLLVALMWGSWWAAVRHSWLLAALLAGLAAITRGDGVLVGVALAVYYLGTNPRLHPRHWPWRAAAAYVGLVISWYGFAWLYFGSPLPATLKAKIVQGTGESAVSFLEGLGYFWTRSFGYEAAWWLPALALVGLGLVALLWRGWGLALPVIWAALFIAGYGLLNVPRYPWYYSPLVPVAMLALVFGGSLLLGLPARLLRSDKIVQGAALAGGLLAALVIGGFYLKSDANATVPEQRAWLKIYEVAGRWIDANTPPDASVGAGEVGIIGFYSKRRMIDFVGLIQPDVAEHSVRLDNLWVLQKYNPDYIVEKPVWLAAVGADPWVQERYTVVHKIEMYGSDPVTILKRK